MHPRIRLLIADAFDIPPDAVPEDASPADIELWDSVGHLNLIQAVENGFSIRLTTDEILGIRSAGDIERLLAHRRVL